MTSREREVYALIREDPMISQDEIAAKLGISRSAVSVHISSLLKQGFLRGRGYVLAEEHYHVVIGVAGIDFRGEVEGDESDSVSENIINYYGRINWIFGGTGYNISYYLNRIGEPVRLIAALGGDMFGKQLAEHCRETGINVDDCLYTPDLPQSIMLQLRDEKNDRRTSMVNYFAEEGMTPQFFSEKARMLKNARTIVINDIATSESVDYLLQEHDNADTWLVFSGVTSRIDRLKTFVPRTKHCYMNLHAAAHIAGVPMDMDVLTIGERLRDLGIREAFVSCENRSILHVTDSGCRTYATLPNTLSDSERGKDAFVAGLLASTGDNRTMEERIRFASEVCRQARTLYSGAYPMSRGTVEQALATR